MNIQNIKSRKIALAPFNAISMALSVLLERQGISIVSIFDNNRKVQEKLFRGIPIYGANEDNVKDLTVIVCSFISLKQIIKQLTQISSENIIEYEDVVNQNDLENMLAAFEEIKLNGDLDNINEYHKNVMFGSGDLSIRAAVPPIDTNKDSIILPLTTLVLTEKCTLRCKECSHFMQYFKKPKEYSADDIISSFDRLLTVASFIRCVGISGGEPLLHKDVLKVAEHVCKSERVGYVTITTNATIMPDENFFIEISKCENLIIRLSAYGEYSKYINQIAEQCEMNHIHYAILNNATWYGGLRITERNEDFEEVKHIFRACSTKDILLKEHSISKCHLACFAQSLEAVPDDAPGIDGCLDILSPDFCTVKLREYLDSNDPLKACSICSGASRTREQVLPAEQIKETLPYKQYKVRV